MSPAEFRPGQKSGRVARDGAVERGVRGGRELLFRRAHRRRPLLHRGHLHLLRRQGLLASILRLSYGRASFPSFRYSIILSPTQIVSPHFVSFLHFVDYLARYSLSGLAIGLNFFVGFRQGFSHFKVLV